MRESGIALRGVRQTGPYEVEASIPARAFRRLHGIARKTRCRVHIVRRRGLPFEARRLFRRPALWITALLVLGLMIFSSTRVLCVRVDGTDRVPEALVLRALRENGVYVGAAKPEKDLRSIAAGVRGYDERIAWAEVELHGVIATVTIVEKERDIVLADDDAPFDVCAVKDGVITSIEAYDGTALVSVGDAVQAGDVLISGTVELPEKEEPLVVHAHGRVTAYVYYFGEAVADTVRTELADTGNSVPYRRLSVCGVTVFESAVTYETCEIRGVRTRTLTDCMLPLLLCTGTACEQAETETAVSQDEQKQAAAVEAEQLALLRVPKDAAIVEKTSRIIEEDGLVRGIVGIMTEESIGLEKEIAD